MKDPSPPTAPAFVAWASLQGRSFVLGLLSTCGYLVAFGALLKRARPRDPLEVGVWQFVGLTLGLIGLGAAAWVVDRRARRKAAAGGGAARRLSPDALYLGGLLALLVQALLIMQPRRLGGAVGPEFAVTALCLACVVCVVRGAALAPAAGPGVARARAVGWILAGLLAAGVLGAQVLGRVGVGGG